jgi:hypothetical protein
MNLSLVSDEDTASTKLEIAWQRAENLFCMGVKSVLELCVGPSFDVLWDAYNAHEITALGNDVDPRWQGEWSDMVWITGDCLHIHWPTSAVVFAPPLSKGCTGIRGDSLLINNVTPTYIEFLQEWRRRINVSQLQSHWSYRPPAIGVLVLPGRSLSTKEDRSQLHRLYSYILNLGFDSVEMIEMIDGCRKYVDIYIQY